MDESVEMFPILAAMLGTPELIILLVIVVLIFGVGKLPEVGRQLGAGIKNFKKEVSEAERPALPGDRETEGDGGLEQRSLPRDVTDVGSPR